MLRSSINAKRFVVRWALPALFVLGHVRVALFRTTEITHSTMEAQRRGLGYESFWSEVWQRPHWS